MPVSTCTYVEIEAFQNFNLVAAMEAGLVDKAPIWTNLKTFNPQPFRGRVHGIIGGYPCQGESLAGKRKLWNDDRFLWPYIERSVSTIRPLFCFFENVGGHLTGSFPYVLKSLRDLGYAVEAGLFTAAEVGAPHKRERLFILAIDQKANKREFRQLLAYATSRNGCNKYESGQNKITATQNSKGELGNPKHNGLSGSKKLRGNEKTSNKRGEKKQEKARESKGTSRPLNVRGLQGSSKGSKLANSYCKGLERSNSQGFEKRRNKQFARSPWPARPGQKQFEWEEPRTVKPGMGCTVNGYNFRTELLRQYGNGVVSQTAELAMRTLIKQLIKLQ